MSADREAKILAMEQQAREAASKRSYHQPSRHVGAIGDRMEFEGEIIKVRTFKKMIEEQESEGHLTIFRTSEGNIVKYWNQLRAKLPDKTKIEPGEGARCKFRATVVEHDEYKGDKNTTVQRAYVISEKVKP